MPAGRSGEYKKVFGRALSLSALGQTKIAFQADLEDPFKALDTQCPRLRKTLPGKADTAHAAEPQVIEYIDEQELHLSGDTRRRNMRLFLCKFVRFSTSEKYT